MSLCDVDICILAAGKGTRMESDLPKVLHILNGKTLLDHILCTLDGLDNINVVVGYGKELVIDSVTGDEVNWVTQEVLNGTGGAVQQASHLFKNEKVLILLGDVPYISKGTLESVFRIGSDLTIVTTILENPTGYGRIVRDSEGDLVTAIVEELDTTDEQRLIAEVNTGIMAVDRVKLTSWLERLDSDNVQGELLLTDIVKYANEDGAEVRAHLVSDSKEVMGINTLEQLTDMNDERNTKFP